MGFEDHRCAPCFDTFSSCQRHTLILQLNYLTPLLTYNYTIITPIQLIIQLSNLTSNFLIYLFTHLCPHSFARTHARTLALPQNLPETFPKASRNLPDKTSSEPPHNLPETFPKTSRNPSRNLPKPFRNLTLTLTDALVMSTT